MNSETLTKNERDSICEGRSISLPRSLWRILERVREDRRDPRLSGTVRELLLDHLVETSYLDERVKKGRHDLVIG